MPCDRFFFALPVHVHEPGELVQIIAFQSSLALFARAL